MRGPSCLSTLPEPNEGNNVPVASEQCGEVKAFKRTAQGTHVILALVVMRSNTAYCSRSEPFSYSSWCYLLMLTRRDTLRSSRAPTGCKVTHSLTNTNATSASVANVIFTRCSACPLDFVAAACHTVFPSPSFNPVMTAILA